jgi:superfamily II DNA or RNA helicase
MDKSFEIIPQSDELLRDYQKSIKLQIYEQWKHHNSIMLQMPTGTGKTRLFTSIVKDIQRHSSNIKTPIRVLIIAHRNELIHQISESVGFKYGLAHGIIMSKYWQQEKLPVQVASVQTLIRRIEEWKPKHFDYIIIDEAHHSLANSYQKICSVFPKAKILGLTATPYRLNGAGFTNMFDNLIQSEPIYEFIKKGYLSPYTYYSISPTSDTQKLINGIKQFDFDGDYSESALTKIFDTNKIRANLFDTYKKYAWGKKGIIYTINIGHNEHVCRVFNEGGVIAKAIDSRTEFSERKKIIDDFRAGKIEVLCNVNIFSEGFDCPDVEFIQLARPTKSLSMYLQQVGRGFRVYQDKNNLIILDNVGLYNSFGLPSISRNWRKYFEGIAYDSIENEEIKNQDIGLNSFEFITLVEEGNEEIGLIYNSVNDIKLKLDYDEIIELQLFLIDRSKELEIKDNDFSRIEQDDFESIEDIDLDFFNEYYQVKKNSDYKLVRKDNLWGVINIDREVIFKPFFDEIALPDKYGCSEVKKEGKIGIIEFDTGNIILNPIFDDIIILRQEFQGYYIVEFEGKFGIVSNIEDVLLPIIYDDIIISDYISVRIGDNWEVFDKNFNQLNNQSFKPTLKIGQLLLVKYIKSFAVVDEYWEIKFPMVISSFEKINSNLLLIKLWHGKYGLLSDNRMDLLTEFKEVKLLSRNNLSVRDENGWGVISIDGDVILPCRFIVIHQHKDIFVVKEGSKWKAISEDLELYTADNKDSVYKFLAKQV